jgi:hypothetical protein
VCHWEVKGEQNKGFNVKKKARDVERGQLSGRALTYIWETLGSISSTTKNSNKGNPLCDIRDRHVYKVFEILRYILRAQTAMTTRKMH